MHKSVITGVDTHIQYMTLYAVNHFESCAEVVTILPVCSKRVEIISRIDWKRCRVVWRYGVNSECCVTDRRRESRR